MCERKFNLLLINYLIDNYLMIRYLPRHLQFSNRIFSKRLNSLNRARHPPEHVHRVFVFLLLCFRSSPSVLTVPANITQPPPHTPHPTQQRRHLQFASRAAARRQHKEEAFFRSWIVFFCFIPPEAFRFYRATASRQTKALRTQFLSAGCISFRFSVFCHPSGTMVRETPSTPRIDGHNWR